MARRPRLRAAQTNAEDENTLQEAYLELQKAYALSRDRKVNVILERVNSLIKSLLPTNFD